MRRNIFIFLLIFVLLTPLWMWVAWLLKPVQNYNVFILDKTVLLPLVQEHLSFSWIINHEKIHHSQYGAHNPQKNYYGFFPLGKGDYKIKDIEALNENELDALVAKYDMVYYTDLYGVYHNEWDATYFPERIKDERYMSNRSQRIYGGMTEQELLFLKKMRSAKKLILNEFNMIASPTSNAVRRKYENFFGLEWSGWVGRYYDDLDTLRNKDIPRWLINNHMEQYGEWPHRKSGIAFVRNDDRVVVLEDSTHLNIDLPFINTDDKYANAYGIIKRIKYPFWFDIVRADSSLNEASTYELSPNAEGRKILNYWNIPTEFPALLIAKDSLYYYMAGDFSDNPIHFNSSYFRGIHYFTGLTYGTDKMERNSFFWEYYRPLITTILKRDIERNGKQ